MTDAAQLGGNVQPPTNGGTDPDTLRELIAIRDRLNEDNAKASETLSTTVRTVATGLALVVYTFFFSKDQSSFVQAHFEDVRLASLLGLMALVADALQYIFALAQIGKTRGLIESGAVPQTVEGVVRARSNVFLTLRDFMFLVKIILVAIGSFIIIDAVFHTTLATVTPN